MIEDLEPIQGKPRWIGVGRLAVLVERWHPWCEAEKARLIAAMNEPGAVVTEIARRSGVDASLLYRWRRQLATSSEPRGFVPVTVLSEIGEAASADASPSNE